MATQLGNRRGVQAVTAAISNSEVAVTNAISKIESTIVTEVQSLGGDVREMRAAVDGMHAHLLGLQAVPPPAKAAGKASAKPKAKATQERAAAKAKAAQERADAKARAAQERAHAAFSKARALARDAGLDV